jgi:hypothetical protein
MKLEIKKNYKVLAKGSTNNPKGDFEVRVYPPCKRTVKLAGRFYFLPIPYQVFGRFAGATDNGRIGSWLFSAFATKSLGKNKRDQGQFVYLPPLGNMGGWQVCLNSGRGADGKEVQHYGQPLEDAFEDLLYKYWNYESFTFGNYNSLKAFGARLHAWTEMTPEQVLKALPNNEMKITLSIFIGLVSSGKGLH